MGRTWQERYATTGWYLAGALAVAAVVQHWGTTRVLVADLGRGAIVVMFIVMALTYARMTWDRRATNMGFSIVLFGIYAMGITGEITLRHLSRLGMPPDAWLGVSFFLVAAGLWAVLLSYGLRVHIGNGNEDDFG